MTNTVPSSEVVNISPDVQFHRIALKDRPESGITRPVVLLFPWLNAKQRAVEKYSSLYLGLGFDVLVVRSTPGCFLWPSVGRTHARRLLDVLTNKDSRLGDVTCVHAISVGAYLYTLVLLEIRRDPDRYSGIRRKIRGQVLDSMVVGGVEKMAVGVSESGVVGTSTAAKAALRKTMVTYFACVNVITGRFYDTAIDAFKSSLIYGPVLVYYSDDDPMSDAAEVRELVERWRASSDVDVSVCSWVTSRHAGHLAQHPEEFCRHLATFFDKLNLEVKSSL